MAPDWSDPEPAAFSGPDPGLPTWYEFVASPAPVAAPPRPALPPDLLAPDLLAPDLPAPDLPAPDLPAPRVMAPPVDAAADGALALAPDVDAASGDDGEAASGHGPRQALRQLVVVPDIEGPHVRLGLVWAVVTTGAAAAGRYELAAWLAVIALAAAGQAARSWRRRPQQPVVFVVIAGSVALPIAAAVGVTALAVCAGAVAIAAVVAPAAIGPSRSGPARPQLNPALTLALALGIGMAAAAPVLVRQRGVVASLVLLALMGVYDASAYIVGGGSSHPWEGPIAGIAFIGAVTLAVAALFVPPFDGASPWVLGGLAAVLAPIGPLTGTMLLGVDDAPAPALRRLDTLLVLGPLWAAAALLLLK